MLCCIQSCLSGKCWRGACSCRVSLPCSGNLVPSCQPAVLQYPTFQCTAALEIWVQPCTIVSLAAASAGRQGAAGLRLAALREPRLTATPMRATEYEHSFCPSKSRQRDWCPPSRVFKGTEKTPDCAAVQSPRLGMRSRATAGSPTASDPSVLQGSPPLLDIL